MKNVFLSYSSKDRIYVDSLILESKNYKNISLWASHKEISPGEDFRTIIETQIIDSDLAIVLVSINSLNSDFITNVEIPALLEKQQNESHFKIYYIFLDDCKVPDYSKLSTKQFFNTPSTNLKSLPSGQLSNLYKDLFKDISKDLSSRKLSFLIKFAMIPVITISLLFYSQVNTEVSQESQVEISVNNTLAELDKSDKEESSAITIEKNNTLVCYGPEIEELWLDNYLDQPATSSLLAITVDCNDKMSAQLYFSENLNLTKNDLTEANKYSITTNSITKCAKEFKQLYGYGSTETLFDFQIFFTEDSLGNMSYNCISVLIPPTTQSFSTFTEDLIFMNISEYRTNNGMFLKSMFELQEGECFNKPAWVYGSSSDRFSENLELSGVYTTYCNSPHNSQVTKIFNYLPIEEESFDVAELNLFNKCLIHTDLFFGDLVEVKENLTSEGWPYLSTQVYTDEEKLRNGEESTVLCIVSNYDYMDIKVDFGYFNLLSGKLAQRTIGDINFMEITNCPTDPIKATYVEESSGKAVSFQFVWNTNQLNLDSLKFIFNDSGSYAEYVYVPDSPYEKEVLNSWSSTQFWVPKGEENGDSLEVSAEMILDNGEIYKDSCVAELILDE